MCHVSKLIFILGMLRSISGWCEPTFTELDAKYSSYKHSPGVAVVVYKNQTLIHKATFGFADLKKKKKIKDFSNFNLASNSKQFTAGLALLLEQENKLKPSDVISKFIPEFAAKYPNVKVEDLVHHTSGLPSYMKLCEEMDKVRNDDIVSFLKNKEPLFSPGQKFEYSNSGYVILSEIIQRIEKKSFRSVLQQKIFQPLKMDHSDVRDESSEHQIKGRVTGYDEWPWFQENDEGPCNYNYGDGGVYTSLKDYPKWLRALFDESLFREVFRKKIFESTLTASGDQTNYSYGWIVDKFDDRPALIHSGSWQGFRSRVVLLPEEKIWITAFSNYSPFPVKDLVKAYTRAALK